MHKRKRKALEADGWKVGTTVVEEPKRVKRTVTAPTTAGQMSGGRVLSVEVGPDEDVEWIWSHDRERGSHVTGYKIVARVPERLSRA